MAVIVDTVIASAAKRPGVSLAAVDCFASLATTKGE